jgi:hypothetical protein
MSSSQNKKETTQVSGIFSIDFNDLGSSGVPGVTQLINPEMLRQKAAAQAKKNKTSTDSIVIPEESSKLVEIGITPAGTTPAEKLNPPSLQSLGILLELQFEIEKGFYRFCRFKFHGQSKAEAWQENFFNQMKIDLKTLEFIGGFEEFSARNSPFHREAFGLTENQFLQLIRIEASSKKVFALLSDKSLSLKKEVILSALQENSDNSSDDSDSLKIELA